jgi:hypothetical protein
MLVRRLRLVVADLRAKPAAFSAYRAGRTPQRSADGTQTVARLQSLLDFHSLFQRQFVICSHRNSLCQIGLGVARGV